MNINLRLSQKEWASSEWFGLFVSMSFITTNSLCCHCNKKKRNKYIYALFENMWLSVSVALFFGS